MVFNVSIPHERHATSAQLDELRRLSKHIVTRDGRRGRYRPVRIGDTLLTSVNARSEAQACRVVADVVGRDQSELVATARDCDDLAPKLVRATAARRTLASHSR